MLLHQFTHLEKVYLRVQNKINLKRYEIFSEHNVSFYKQYYVFDILLKLSMCMHTVAVIRLQLGKKTNNLFLKYKTTLYLFSQRMKIKLIILNVPIDKIK